MATRRRPRGTLVDPVAIGYEIERSAKQRLDAIARNSGVSGSYMLQLLIERLELNEKGVPKWWTPISSEEELPIPAA